MFTTSANILQVQPALGGVYRQFKYSTVKEASLHEFQKELDLPVLKLKEAKHVRWLSYDAAVKAFLRSYPAIVLELEREAEEENDAAAVGWLNRVKCYEFVASLRLLADVLPILSRLSKKFQAAHLHFGRMKESLDTAVTAMKALKATPGPLYASTDDFIESLRSTNPDKDVTITVSKARKDAFDRNVRRAYLQAVIDCLSQRFPQVPVLDALSIFCPEKFPKPDSESETFATYGRDHLDVLLKKLAAEEGPNFVDPDDARSEWLELKATVAHTGNLRKCKDVSDLVQQLLLNHTTDFPNLIKIAEWGLAIPMSTADCERDFSLMKLVKTARRNSLSNKSLEQLMAIKLDAPDIHNFPFDEALAEWQGKVIRRTATASLTETEKDELQRTEEASLGSTSATALQPLLQQMPTTLSRQVSSWLEQLQPV